MKQDEYYYAIFYDNKEVATLFRFTSVDSLGKFVREKSSSGIVSIVQSSDDVVIIAYARAEARGLDWAEGIDLTNRERLSAHGS